MTSTLTQTWLSFFHRFYHVSVQSLTSYTLRPWGKSLKLCFFVIIIGLACNYNLLKFKPLFEDLHAIQSVELAYNAVYCGKQSYLDMAISPKQMTSFLEPKSTEEINKQCQQLTTSFQQNENSLRIIYEIIFTLFPQLTIFQLGIILFCFKVTFFSVFLLALTRIGFNAIGLFLVFSTYLLINYHLNLSSTYSVYSFFIPLSLMLVGLLFVNIDLKIYQKSWIQFIFFLGIGLFGSFLTNYRTSYFIVFLAVVASYIFTLFFMTSFTMKKRLFLSITFIPIILGYLTFEKCIMNQYIVIRPDVQNYSYHAIGHAMVLSLGLDKSDLAKKEGILWLDEKGVEIAQRMDRSLQMYDKNYDGALINYYFSLWKAYPVEMIEIYVKRFFMQQTASSISKTLKGIKFINSFYLLPLNILDMIFFSLGIMSHSLFLAFLLFLFRNRKKMEASALFLLSTLFVVAEVIMMESLAIYPFKSIQYFSIPTFASYFLIILILAPWLPHIQKQFFLLTAKLKNSFSRQID